MYSDILQTVRSVSERDTLISEIEVLKKSLFEPQSGGVEAVLKSEVRSNIASLLKVEIEKTASVGDYLDGLLQELKNIEEVKLNLAIEPTDSIVEVIYSWIASNLKSRVVLDITFNPTLIGGAQISYKGKYYDGSLSSVLENARLQ